MVAPASIQAAREEVMDFSFPFYIEESVILYRRQRKAHRAVFQFLRPYKWQVWVSVMAAIPLATVLLAMFFSINSRGHIRSGVHMYDGPQISPVGSISKAFWCILGTLFTQGKLESLTHLKL